MAVGGGHMPAMRRGRRDPARERLAAAMVAMVAEGGMEAVGVDALCERAEVGRAHFYRCFADLEECFLTLHEEALSDLCTEVDVAAEGCVRWHDRVWAMGVVAMRFLQDDPLRARFLIAAVNGAGRGPQRCRERLIGGIADRLDCGREGLGGGVGAGARVTAEAAAGAVYSALLAKLEAGALDRGEEFLPELIYLAVMPYLGQTVAESELAVQPLR